MRRRTLVTAWLLLTVMVLSVILPASAETPAGASEVMDSLEKLFLDTDNMTFHGKAAFSYDGKEFHSLEAEQQIEGVKQYRRQVYNTPDDFLLAYEEGVSEQAQYIDGVKYFEIYDDASFSSFVIAQPRKGMFHADDYERVMISLIKSASTALLEGKLTAGEKQTSFSLKAEDFPGMMDPLLTFLVMSWHARNGYLTEDTTENTAPVVEHEMWSESFAAYARNMLHFPETLVEAFRSEDVMLTDEGWEKHNEALESYHEWVRNQQVERTSGVLYIRGDCSVQWYDTLEDLMRSKGRMWLDYPDLKTMFELVFPDEVYPYGEDEDVEHNDPALVKRFVDYFRSKDPNVVGARVMGNGTIATYTSATAYNLGVYSVKDRISMMIRGIQVQKAEGTLTFDEQGRITAMQAALTAEIRDMFGETHTLTMTGDFTVTNYGTTKVELHDTEEPGAPMEDGDAELEEGGSNS